MATQRGQRHDPAQQTKDGERGERDEMRFIALVGLFVLAELGMISAAIVWLAVKAPLVALSCTVAAAGLSLLFFATIVLAIRPHDADADCWEALYQALIAWRQAAREQEDERGRLLSERGRGALQIALDCQPSCRLLQRTLERLRNVLLVRQAANEVSKFRSSWREEVAYTLGVLLSLNPFAVPSVAKAIWAQGLWQLWAMSVGIVTASVAWYGLNSAPSRALLYAVSSGMVGASFYNLRALAEHIAVDRDYSTRFWVDYLTRPLLGATLGAVVYAFAVGLVWALTLQGPVNLQTPEAMFALGFLSGYALRSALLWLNSIAKTVFRTETQRAERGEPPEGVP